MRELKALLLRPASDHDSGVAVGVFFVPAGCTPKHGLAGAVLFVDVAARRALAAGVTRIDNENRNAGTTRLVGNKIAQLSETPVVQAFPLLQIGLNPGANAFEVFKGNRAAGAFSFGNDATRNVVVDPLLKTALLSAHFPKPTFRGLGSFLLQQGATPGIPFALGFYLLAAELFARGIGCQINDAQINSKNTFRGQQFGIVKVTHGGDVPMAAHKHQIHFALAMLEQLALMFAANEPDFDAPVQRPDRNPVIGQKPENPVVIRLRAQRAKRALRFLVQLVGVGHFCDATHGHLRSKVKLLSNGLINQLMQIKLPECFSLPSLYRNPVTRLVAPFKRLLEQFSLFGRRLQFDVSHKFHSSIIESILGCVNTADRALHGSLYLPIAKARGFSRGFR